MARKIKTSSGEQAPQAPPHYVDPPVRVVTASDIITEGDYAGMTYDEVFEKVSAKIDEAYEDCSLKGACSIHDAKLKQLLYMTEYYEGPGAAHEAAILFGQTLMPFLNTPTPKLRKAYGELLRLKYEQERGEDE